MGDFAERWAEPVERIVGLDERAWLPRHCRGDADAFAELLAAYRRPVYSYLARFGVDAMARDDLFQEIFLKIHASAGSYRPARPLRPWIFTIVANTVRNHFRSRARHRAVPFERADETPDPSPSTEAVAHGREMARWLEEAMAALPLPQREVLVMTSVDGLRMHEVAEALGMPLNTVKTNLRRGRLRLAKALAQLEAPRAPETGDHANL